MSDFNEIRIKKIKEVGIVTTGATPLRNCKEYFENGVIPWVKTTDLNNGNINVTEESITELAVRKTSVKLLPKGTVLVAMYGGFNQIGRTGILSTEATTNQAISAIKVDSNIIIPRYLLNYLNFMVNDWKNYAASSRKDPNITKKDVEDFSIMILPIIEQEKVVEILSAWDLAIEKQQKLIEKKKEFKKGLMQFLYSQGTRKDKRIKTKIGEVPASWKVVKAKEIFENISIKNNEKEELLSVTQDRGTIPRTLLEGSVVMPEGSTKGYKLVVPNNFIISLRSFQGGIEISKYRGIISPAYTVLENKVDICYDYFKYYFKKESFISRLNGIIVGIRDGKQISYSDFSEMYLPVPPIEEQEKIAEILTLADKEIGLLQKELEALKLQKKGLMQRLLTGEVRVKI